MKRFFWLILVPLFAWFGRDGVRTIQAQGPTVTQSYGLTLERDDFPPSNAGDSTFSTPVSARSSFVLVYRNGLLQRAGLNCAPVPPAPAPCDYTQSGNVIVTYPSGAIQAGDLVTILFQR
jgi:hypothetical protein